MHLLTLQMSIFLAGALYSLAFGMILTSIMIIAFEGYVNKRWWHIIYAPAMHFLAALMVSLVVAPGHSAGCLPSSMCNDSSAAV